MKVIKPGVFLFIDGCVHADQWIFDSEGVRYTSMVEQKRDVCRTILAHLAEGMGVEAPASERMTLESERAALDAIAMVRWPACGD